MGMVGVMGIVFERFESSNSSWEQLLQQNAFNNDVRNLGYSEILN